MICGVASIRGSVAGYRHEELLLIPKGMTAITGQTI